MDAMFIENGRIYNKMQVNEEVKGLELNAFGSYSGILKVSGLGVRQGHWATKCFCSWSAAGDEQKVITRQSECKSTTARLSVV